MNLYHGSMNKEFTPQYGLGEKKHDYGCGFYLTRDVELAKEWAVCNPNSTNGWVHKYTLDCDGLKILDFEKYGVDTEDYDVIKGWRTNASYFYITKAFVRDEVDIDILEDLFHFGNLGIQYCLKSETAFLKLKEDRKGLLEVDYSDLINIIWNEIAEQGQE